MGLIQTIKDAFKPPDPKEVVRKWQREVRREERKVDREIRDIDRAQKVAQQSIREAAKRNDVASCKILAKSFMHSKKALNRLYQSKANLVGMHTQLQQQLALVRVTGHLEKSAEVLSVMNQLMSIPATAASLRDMQKEMYKAGMIEEMMNDGLADAMGDDEVEEEAEEEVNKVLEEIAGDIMTALPGAPAKRQEVAEAGVEQENVKQRLDALRS